MKGRVVRLAPIHSMADLEERVSRLGFLPMFKNGIRGFSVYESTPSFWSSDEDGPWEWKGPIIRGGSCAYGKFFARKAGYVSLEWYPDFINYRRTKRLAPDDDAAMMDDVLLQVIHSEGRICIKDLRKLLGLGRRKRSQFDLVDELPVAGKVNLDTNLSRLMMEGRVTIADFTYNIDKRGNQYGWGIAIYTTPELLYGSDIKAVCSPDESYERMFRHLTQTLPGVPIPQIKKLLG